MSILPNHRLLALAFRRVPVTAPSIRAFSTNPSLSAWDGRKPEENTTRTKEEMSGNVQADAIKGGQAEKKNEDSKASGATSEKDHQSANKKAEEDHPEAPGPVIGMNDERGSKGH